MNGYPQWPELFRWLTVLKDRVETLPSISAEQVITGTLDPSLIPPIPWDLVLKAGSSLGDLETRSAGDLSSGTLLDARMPALDGDVSSVAGDVTTTLATVNASPGTYGSGASIPLITVNGKGLVTDVMTTPIATGSLTRSNDTNVTVTLTGTPASALLKDVLMTLGWTGTLAVSRGGTNIASYAVGDLLYASGATTLSKLADVAVGSYLRSGGVTTAPLWSTLKLPNAVTAGSVVFASATDTYGQDNANLFWDDSNNRLGILTASPGTSFQIGTTTNFQLGLDFTGTVFGGGTRPAFVMSNGGTVNLYAQVITNAALWGTLSAHSLVFQTSGTNRAKFNPTGGMGFGTVFANTVDPGTDNIAFGGKVGVGVSATLTALVHIAAGTATASTAPLKFTSGTLLTTAESGAHEFLTDDFFLTITTGAARKGIVLDDGARLTSGRVPFATTNGRLTDDSDLTFATDTLSATKVVAPTSVSTPSIITASGSLTITPAAGSNLNIALSTTGDLAVNTNQIYVDTSAAAVGFGTSSPTARIHAAAGTTAAGTAPLKLTSGTNLTTAEAGAMEYDGTDLFFTRAGTVRENVLVAIDNVAAPTTSIGVAIVNFYGANATNYLGDPNRWLSVNVLGATYKIPLYT